MLRLNPNIKLIISDVDDTLAPIYQPIKSKMINKMENLLEKGVVFF